MDKEKIITIVIGLSVGVLVAALYFIANRYLPTQQTPTPKVSFSPTATPAAQLSIISPTDFATVTDSPVTITGQTVPNTTLVVYANSDEKIASADATGKFSIDVKLEDGDNAITVTSLKNSLPSETVSRHVILEIKP